jgi:hypothetical protein
MADELRARADGSKAAAAGGGGVGFFGLLALLFIALKLCGIIEWSWWLVLLPLWGPFLAGVAFVVVVVTLALVVDAFER